MRSILSHRSLRAAVAMLLAVAVAAATLSASMVNARVTPDALPTVALADLPKEAREVYARIGGGGPFANECAGSPQARIAPSRKDGAQRQGCSFDRDGVVFGNREGLLPAKPRGYYHEYTVRTPGERTRGARRIVCGGPATTPEACYYTDDHYQSFRRIRE